MRDQKPELYFDFRKTLPQIDDVQTFLTQPDRRRMNVFIYTGDFTLEQREMLTKVWDYCRDDPGDQECPSSSYCVIL